MAPSPTPQHAHGHESDDIDDHDRGLVFDLQTLMQRRNAIKLFGGFGLVALAGCTTGTTTTTSSSSTGSSSSSTSSASSGASGSSDSSSTTGSCVEEVPTETAGPFPGDGSNGPNVLTESGIVRRDITKSFGSSSGVAAGVPLTVKLTVQDAGCAALSGAAVYIWHCDREGRYSLYSDGVTGENYLRGVQEADSSGTVTFTTVFPAAYSGRWPHIHFEVYASLSEATAAGKISATSQIALPEAACNEVYATGGYEQSVGNMARTSLTSDNVFGDDGGMRQLATATGSASSGYTAALTVSV